MVTCSLGGGEYAGRGLICTVEVVDYRPPFCHAGNKGESEVKSQASITREEGGFFRLVRTVLYHHAMILGIIVAVPA
jgi:hypothetical protein